MADRFSLCQPELSYQFYSDPPGIAEPVPSPLLCFTLHLGPALLNRTPALSLLPRFYWPILIGDIAFEIPQEIGLVCRKNDITGIISTRLLNRFYKIEAK